MIRSLVEHHMKKIQVIFDLLIPTRKFSNWRRRVCVKPWVGGEVDEISGD